MSDVEDEIDIESVLYCDDCDEIKPKLYCRDCGGEYLADKHTLECRENDDPSLEYVCRGCLPYRLKPWGD